MTLLAGGVGGARMARALRAVLDPGHLTIVVNVGDDTERYGVHVAADPDTVLYTLAGVVGEGGWGRAQDTTNVMQELAELGVDTTFTLGDRDLALCLQRTQLLRQGVRLSTITQQFAEQFGLGDLALLPATDDALRTWVQVTDGSWLPFQEYFVDRQHRDDVLAVAYHGSTDATPAPGVVEAIRSADTVVIAPSNPPLSIWPTLAIDDVAEAVAGHGNRVGVSPLFGGRPIKGPADRVMTGVGLSSGTRGILEAYEGFIDRLYIDTADESDVSMATEFGVEIAACDTRLTGELNGAPLATSIIGDGHDN